MINIPAAKEKLYLGIDGGGSKCRALIVTGSGQVLGTGSGGPANAFADLEQTFVSIQAATEFALHEAGLPLSSINQLIAGVGLAGVNVPRVFDQVNSWQHPFKQLFLTTDLHIASLGAHRSDDGAVIVAGTGSCGYSHVQGRVSMLGGHGFPAGDIGSGAWFGLEAIRAVLLAADNLGAPTLLSDLISQHLQAKGVAIVDKMAGAKASDYAALAGFVFDAAERGDDLALSLVKQGAAYIDALAQQLWLTNPARMSLVGGLSHRLMPWLAPSIRERLSPPLDSSEAGAIYHARNMSQLGI